MEAAGSEKAVVFGTSEGGAMAALFAATYPERVSALVVIAPSVADDPRMRDWWSKWERLSCSPGTARRLLEVAFQFDIRDVLPAIHVPTLIVHRAGDRFAPVEHGRYLADHIPGAYYVELPGVDHPHFIGAMDSAIGEVEAFVTGQRETRPTERTLLTVLFTDIAGSTQRAAAMGDAAWRDLLEVHDRTVRRELARHRGREVDRAGDGFLAAFDGPARAVRCGQVAAHARPGEVLVSRTVRDMVVGSGLRFEGRGEFSLKGVPGEWELLSAA